MLYGIIKEVNVPGYGLIPDEVMKETTLNFEGMTINNILNSITNSQADYINVVGININKLNMVIDVLRKSSEMEIQSLSVQIRDAATNEVYKQHRHNLIKQFSLQE